MIKLRKPRGSELPKVRNEEATACWDKFEFPVKDLTDLASWRAHGQEWFAAYNTLTTPYCWTPSKNFYFIKEFIALYPCIAFTTRNFGSIIQRGPQGIITARY